MVIRDSYHKGFHRFIPKNGESIATSSGVFFYFKNIFKKYLTIYFKSLKLKSFKGTKEKTK